MNRKIWAYSVLGGALALSALNLKAQQSDAEMPAPPPVLMLQSALPEGSEPFGFGERMELLGFGGLRGGKVVTGLPFSAIAVSEFTQTLADGNRITRTTQSPVYRDSQGRFRRQVNVPPFASAGQGHSVIIISDPGTGVGYALEPDQKIARKMPGHAVMKDGHGGPGAPGDHARKSRAQTDVQEESLPQQTVNGVKVQGTRYTRTIAAHEIGNENPIVIVSERWYSPDLQMVVMSKHSDPRFGESKYSLTKIERTEPDASLFTVPADYTVKEGGPGRGMRKFHGAPPADVPRPPSN